MATVYYDPANRPMQPLCLDIATAALPDAAQFLDPVMAPANYKDPAKIAAYIEEKEAEKAERAGLDPDLCRITGVGYCRADGVVTVLMADSLKEEKQLLAHIAPMLRAGVSQLIGFNALRFDWPVLMRRARYLGVSFPTINTDRFKSPHVDLFEVLTNHGQLPSHSLRFYASRLGWLDIEKPLDGAAEAKVFESGDWDGLQASIIHDTTATYRLAKWLEVI